MRRRHNTGNVDLPLVSAVAGYRLFFVAILLIGFSRTNGKQKEKQVAKRFFIVLTASFFLIPCFRTTRQRKCAAAASDSDSDSELSNVYAFLMIYVCATVLI
jgi:hypothetical protein